MLIRSDAELIARGAKLVAEYNLEFESTKYRYGYYDSDGDFVLHRNGGPATLYSNGYTAWHNDGIYHREDGPAVYFFKSRKNPYWYYKGERVEVKSTKDFLNWIKLQNF